MTQNFLALSLGLAGVILAAHASFGQDQPAQCAPRDTVTADLAQRYGETRRAWGLAANAVVEIYASAQTGSWTIAVSTPDGQMCLVAAGQGFETDPDQTPAKGEKI